MRRRRWRRWPDDYRGANEVVVRVVRECNVGGDGPVRSRGGHLTDVDEPLLLPRNG